MVWGNLLEFPLLAKFLTKEGKGMSRSRIPELEKLVDF
jgi:hypothetical protein